MKTVLLILRGEAETKKLEVDQFTMIEPSTMHIRFRTIGGEVLEAHGLLVESQPIGALDDLPFCPFPNLGAQ